MKKILLVFLLLSSTVGATTRILTSDSLPYSAIVSNDTIYIDGDKITSATNGIIFSGVHDILLDMGTDTIVFGTDNSDSCYGVACFINAYNITVNGGFILHEPTDTSWGCSPVRIWGGWDFYFDSTVLNVKGYDAHAIFKTTSGATFYNWEFDGGRWSSDVVGYTSRCNYDGAIAHIKEGAFTTVTGDDYHFKIHDVVIPTSPGQGIVTEGKAIIYNNDITIDARNDFYEPGAPGTCEGQGNAGAIMGWGLQAGSKIYNNTITAGTDYSGCDIAIMLEVSEATLSNPIEVYDNTIDIHYGKDDHYGFLNSKGIKTRFGNKHLRIYDNDITVTIGDTSDMAGSTSAYGTQAMGISIFSFVNEGHPPDSFVIYENNTIEIIARADDYANAYAVDLGLSNVNDYYGAGNRCRYNNLKAPRIYRLGTPGGNVTGSYFVAEGDTVQFDDSVNTNWYKLIYEVGFLDIHDTKYAKTRDVVYLGEAADSINSSPSETFTLIANSDKDFRFERTLSILTITSDSVPIEGAICSVFNSYNDVSFIDTSDASGLISGVVSYWYEDNYDLDTTDFNDFVIDAWYGINAGYDSAFTVGWNDFTDTITISSGELYQINTIIDTTVLSIQVSTDYGDISGALDSGWFYYDTFNPPTTLRDSVASQSDPYVWNLLGLVHNTKYYFYTKARDASTTNSSPIDSVTTKYAYSTIYKGGITFGEGVIKK